MARLLEVFFRCYTVGVFTNELISASGSKKVNSFHVIKMDLLAVNLRLTAMLSINLRNLLHESRILF